VRRPVKLTPLVLVAVSLVCLHVICLLVFRAQATVVTYPFLALAPLLACASCCWRAATEEPASRSPWVLLSAGTFLWTCGISLSAWEDIFQHSPQSAAWFSDFSFFLYGVPVLLAISSASAKQRIPFFIWMDAAQALLTGFLAYVSIFSVVPFSDIPLAPVSASTLVLTYNTENFILAVAATLRLFAQPRGQERRFYVVLFWFLWIYAVIAYVYNSWAAVMDLHSMMDVLVDLPFLFLAVANMAPRTLRVEAGQAPHKQTLAIFVENVSPIFYTVALLALSTSLMRQHFYAGTVGTFTAIVVYATRSTLLQGRYIRIQRELHEARDRLEQMALTDALTDTANRRRFDEALVLEWGRAVRNRHPLALLLVDIDYFKMLNDRYGHPGGDRCLVSVARALQSALPRSGDLLARYGGEEFAAILPSTDEAGARRVAQTMQEAVRMLKIRNETSTGPFLTVSVGIAVFELPQGTPADIIEAADQALYRAKQRGRNRIEATGQHDFLPNGTQ
jgi:diguanylate cyclase (GGDEF)-like protein